MSEKKTNASGRHDQKAALASPEMEKEQKLTIEVSKFSTFVKAVTEEKWWRFLVFTFLIGCVLFTGIAAIALAVKRLYPYSDITTNGLGATTIKNENSEVSYWLYNTAILWADSGISVEKGDIITIRCSGKFHTAMHHVYEAAKNNTKLSEEWIGPEGVTDDPNNLPGSYRRRKFRIFPGMPTGALVMQVAKNEPYDSPEDSLAKSEDFYYIGGERENIYINNPGTLYFGLNDIVFNRKTIETMFAEAIKESPSFILYRKPQTDINQAFKDYVEKNSNGGNDTIIKLANAYEAAYQKEFAYLRKEIKNADIIEKDSFLNIDYSEALKYVTAKVGCDSLPDRIRKSIWNYWKVNQYDGEEEKEEREERVKTAYATLINELVSNRAIGEMRLGTAKNNSGEIISEVLQYYNLDYKEAWYDDNVGSFLVIVEKKTR